MNEKIKIELSQEQFGALIHCMLSYHQVVDYEDNDKVIMAKFLLSKVLKKMINRYHNLKRRTKLSLSWAEAAAFRTLMGDQIEHFGIYEQAIIRDILMQIGRTI